MRSHLLPSTAAVGLALLVVGVAGAADTKSSSSATKAPGKGAAKGTLPDPAIFDGSAFPADKKSETGMIGDFELPGDENARNGKIGGPQIPVPMPGAGVPGLPTPAGGGLPGLPMPSAGGLPSPLPSAGGAPDLSIPSLPDPLAQQQGGGGAGGPNAPQAGQSSQGGAEGQQGGAAEGRQVSSLGGEGGGPEVGQISKPQAIGIGDPAMQIKTAANAPSVVGGSSPGSGQGVQNVEGKMGTGGKAAQGNNSNKGSERGRAIPAGL